METITQDYEVQTSRLRRSNLETILKTKQCTNCKEVLPIESFGAYTVKKTQKTYHNPTCRSCFRLRMKKVYLKEKKVICDCGSNIKLRSYKFHLTSKKHQKYLASKAGESLVEVDALAKNLKSSDAPEL